MDNTEKAFDSAIESSKLLITISSAIIGGTIAFMDKEKVMQPNEVSQKVVLLVSWIILGVSAGIGLLWTQMAFVSTLKPRNAVQNFEPDIRSRKITVPYKLQIYTFLLGVFLTIIFAATKMFDSSVSECPDL